MGEGWGWVGGGGWVCLWVCVWGGGWVGLVWGVWCAVGVPCVCGGGGVVRRVLCVRVLEQHQCPAVSGAWWGRRAPVPGSRLMLGG